MAVLAVTNDFTTGTTIVAADVNQNFTDVESFVNTTPGLLQNSLVDVKGDLLVATADNTIARLPAGTDDYALIADSTNANGVKWDALPASSVITVADTTSATCSVALFEAETGNLAPKTDGALDYNAATGSLSTTLLDVTGVLTAGSVVAPLAFNAQVGTTYTFVLADAGKMVTFANAGAQTVTVPPNSAVAFTVGTQIILQGILAGVVTLVAGAGVTINSKDAALAIDGQWAAVTLIKTATDVWSLIGALA
jgi:hypothetical protein